MSIFVKKYRYKYIILIKMYTYNYKKVISLDNKTAAVIDIASNELRLKIAQKSKGEIKTIESLSYPLSLGKDTFHDEKISFESVKKTAQTIKGFQNVMKDYGVKVVRAIATTAVREASNKEYILDQIKVKTGIELEVIDDSSEKIYVNKLILNNLPAEYKESSLLVHLGSGNISIFILENSLLKGVKNIKLGALRLSELFDDVADDSFEYQNVIKEYLQSFIESIEQFIPKNIKNFVMTGTEIELISSLCNAEIINNHENIINRDSFMQLYKGIKTLTPAQISAKLNITADKADILLPALIVYTRLIKYTKADKILAPKVALSDCILYELLSPEKWEKISDEYSKNSIISAQEIAQKFGMDLNYTDRVSKYALKIFDRLNKIHGLGKRERLLLHVSCILHNIGKFVNLKQHYIHSYNIIKGLDLVGLNERECLLVASISLFHSRITPSTNREEYLELKPKDRVLVSKLCAILRLADSLNRSHNLKFDDIDVSLTQEELVITVKTAKDIELEMWSFSTKSKLFEDVYGIKAVLKKRRVI